MEARPIKIIILMEEEDHFNLFASKHFVSVFFNSRFTFSLAQLSDLPSAVRSRAEEQVILLFLFGICTAFFLVLLCFWCRRKKGNMEE